MLKRILVPLDGSARAEQALAVAARIARTSNGTITVLQAVSPPSPFMEEVGTIVLPEILDEDVTVAKDYLKGVAHGSSLEDIQTVTRVVTGHPAQAILAEAHAEHFDLIVLSSHGATHVTHWSMGSIAAKVARHSPAPVLILHEGRSIFPPAETRSARMLVALDGSRYAEASIVPAAMLASTLSAPAHGELHLTRVVSSHASVDSSFEQEVAKTQQYLGSIAERLQQHAFADESIPPGLLVTWSVTLADDAAIGILQAAEKGGQGACMGQNGSCQAIAMATHGLGGPQLWTLGSTTERVLQAMRQPLLIVRR